MTVVIEGKMSVQFFKKDGEKLVEDGKPLILNKGDAGYIESGRIHDAKYLEDCKLVYVHDKQFGFRRSRERLILTTVNTTYLSINTPSWYGSDGNIILILICFNNNNNNNNIYLLIHHHGTVRVPMVI